MRADRLVYGGFLLLLAWLPLPLGSNRPWSSALAELWIVALALLWAVQYLRGTVRVSTAFRAAWPVLLMLGVATGWVWLQAVALPADIVQKVSPAAFALQQAAAAPHTLSLSPQDTLAAAGRATALLVMFALALLLVNSRARLRQLIMFLALCGVFQAAWGALMVLSGLEYLLLTAKEAYIGHATGTFVNRNHLAGWLNLCLSLGVGLLIADLRGSASSWREGALRLLRTLLEPKARLRVYLAVMVIGLVLTHSRMGNMAFFVSLTLTALLHALLTRRVTRAGVVLFASLLLVDVAIVGNFFGFERVVERLQGTSAQTEQRDEYVEDGLRMLADYPLTGIGAGAFYATYPQYQSEGVDGFVQHAHNDYLQFALELGKPAAVLLGLVVLLCAAQAALAQFCRHDPLMQGVAAGALMGIIALMTHSAVDFNLQIPANAALFMVVLALPWVARHHR